MTAAVAHEAPPSVKEELTRKAFEHLERLAFQLDSGQINEAMFDTGVRAVWNCVSGLVDEWLIQTISEIKDRVDASHFERRMFVSRVGGTLKAVFLSRKLGGGELKISAILDGSKPAVMNFDTESNPSAACKRAMDETTEALLGKGWKRAF